ncbi:hypothetical protein T07_12362 [Trichinella nelsoni]|uniref:Uncharacterized protein n=1 Tax=Trichinella nelsoni TaxID=6336 RepID=A0A0V0RP56_9BILA|nr:hypothetical protein T07_12362 [Trichinella nelsoni]
MPLSVRNLSILLKSGLLLDNINFWCYEPGKRSVTFIQLKLINNAAIAKKRDVEHSRRNHWLRMIEDYIKQKAKPNIIKSAFENEGMRNPIGFSFRTKKLG